MAISRRRFVPGMLLALICAQAIFFNTAQSSHTTTTKTTPATVVEDPRVVKLRESLQIAPNFLQYTEYKMLKYKNRSSTSAYDPYAYNDYSLKPAGASPLSLELYGGVGSAGNAYLYGGLGSNIDLLTGTRAINETLQIGSIGSGDIAPRTRADQRQLELALELYYDANKSSYPDRLNQLAPKYIARIPVGFSYRRRGVAYDLSFGSLSQTDLTIKDITPLSIKSHPWAEMTKKQVPDVPKIFSIIPADDFVVYFRDLDKFTELEKVIQQASLPLERVYGLKDTLAIKDLIMKRLGIRDIPELRKFIDEAAFVSYDISFYPNTDYALILKLKSSLAQSFISEFIAAPEDQKGSVGDYYVVATSPDFYKSIASSRQPLSEAADLKYTLSVLETNYDGFVFISEDFVKKLTNPAYRLNSRRRNSIMGALESLQYTVFAYRDLKGQWPKTLGQISSEGYIAPDSVANIVDYNIGADGVVRHKVWGTIYDIASLISVPIDTISSGERDLYNAFREGYQQFWREFIDPVGISIIVGDQIRFHTIILPLIDESQYNWIKNISGGDPVSFQFIKDPDRLTSLQFVAKFNLDDTLYAYYKSFGYTLDASYIKCRKDYYASSDYRDFSRPNRKTLDQACPSAEKNKEDAVQVVKKQVADAIGWKEKEDVLGFVGSELTFGAGDTLDFKLTDLTKFDVFFGAALKDTALAKKFIDHVFTAVASEFQNEFSGSDFEGEGLVGFFAPQISEPIKNTYNGSDFYIIPLGFTNLYYMFLNDRMYVTVSQKAINQFIDGSKSKEKLSWGSSMTRLFDYLGEKHNVIGFSDVSKMQSWIKGMIRESWESYGSSRNFQWSRAYYAEMIALGKTFSSGDSEAKKYYHFAPESWYEAKLSSRNGIAYLSFDGKEYDIRKINANKLRSSFYDYPEDEKSKPTYDIELSDIAKKFDIDKAFKEWGTIKDFGAGLTISSDGLDIKVAFNNPLNTKHDSRIPGTNRSTQELPWKYISIGGGVVALCVFGWLLFLMKRSSTNSLNTISSVGEVVSAASVAATIPTQSVLQTPPPPLAPVIPAAVIEFVSQCRKTAVPEDKIRELLVANGWPADIISQALSNQK